MSLPFSEWIHNMIATRSAVSIGEGENQVSGTIVAFDEQHGVVTFETGHVSHYIPLTSIRSFGCEDTVHGISCSMELFKR